MSFGEEGEKEMKLGALSKVLLFAAVVGMAKPQANPQVKQAMTQVMNLLQSSLVWVELSRIRMTLKWRYLDKKIPTDTDQLRRHIREYMRSDVRDDVSKDPWLTPYQMEENDKGIRLFSCGPDRECYTKDDISIQL